MSDYHVHVGVFVYVPKKVYDKWRKKTAHEVVSASEQGKDGLCLQECLDSLRAQGKPIPDGVLRVNHDTVYVNRDPT